MNRVRLRPTTIADLGVLYDQETEAEALRLANLPLRTREFFTAHWTERVLGNPDTIARTVEVDGVIAGHLVRWIDDGDPRWDDEHLHMVSFGFGREYRGAAVSALRSFLAEVGHRPLHAEVSAGDAEAVRMLTENGFAVADRYAAENHHGEGTVEHIEFTLAPGPE